MERPFMRHDQQTMWTQQTDYHYDPKAPVSAGATEVSVSLAPPEDPLTTTKPKPKRVRRKTERRREQCRRNQARYRNKQRLQIFALETEVNDLLVQLARLEEERESLYHSVDTREATVKTVLEFFRLFRYGFDIDKTDPLHLATPLTQRRYSTRLDQQLAFIDAVVADDVRVDDFYGRDNFIEQTERFSTFFDGFELRPYVVNDVVIGPDGITLVHALVEVDLLITLTTINQVFPAVCASPMLKWTLLGHRMRCPASVIYELDKNHCILGTDWTIDFVSGLVDVLSMEEIGLVFQTARVQHDVYLLGNGDVDLKANTREDVLETTFNPDSESIIV